MTDEVTIPARFNGPPASANGGYACGLVAAAVPSEAVQVSLRLPPPLDVPLTRRRTGDGMVTLSHGDALIAEGRPADGVPEPPAAPPLGDAEDAMSRYAGLEHHMFPTCFVCGPARSEDGLRIFPGPVGDGRIVASAWRPHEAVDPEIVWAALDCPSAFACSFGAMAVLASMTARLTGEVRAGRPHVVAAWPIGRDGRKHRAGSAVYTEGGTPLAVAEALWIELKEPGGFAAAQ